MKQISKKWLENQYWKKNLSIASIARKTQKSCQSIFRYMKKWDIPRRNHSDGQKNFLIKNSAALLKRKINLSISSRKRKIEIAKKDLLTLYIEQQKSTVDIAKIYKCSSPTVSARLSEAGIPLRSLSERKMGRLNPSFGKHDVKSFRWGQQHSADTKQKIKEKVPKGATHPNWKMPKDRIESVNKQIRNCYKTKKWKRHILSRDGHKCVLCDSTQEENKLHVDHIIPFAEIKTKYKITTLEDAYKCMALWDLSNGRTLCQPCHVKTATWGPKKKRIKNV